LPSLTVVSFRVFKRWLRSGIPSGDDGMKKILVLLIFIFVTFAVGWVIDLFWKAGQFMTIKPHFAGQCRRVSGAVGPEDITIHPQTGVAYISSADRRAIAQGEAKNGAIFAYNLKYSQPELIRLNDETAPELQPHGISLYPEPNGKDVLYVVNHAGGRHSVEIFDVVMGRLVHRRTVTDALIHSPNDVAAAGPDSFYLTNDHHFDRDSLRRLEDYLQLRQSEVVYCKATACTVAAEGIGYANGINLSSDGRLLYVTATTEQSLRIFSRHRDSGRLELLETVYLGTGVDNVEIAANGDLWLGAHPQMLKFVKHAADEKVRSPSQVLRVFRNSAGRYKSEEVFLNRGLELSASSVAAVFDKRLLIGAVFDPAFLDCRLD